MRLSLNHVVGFTVCLGFGVAATDPRCQAPTANARELAATDASTSASVTLIDEQGAQHTFDEAVLAELPQRNVEVKERQTSKVYEGASLTDVLEHVGVKFGEQLKGRRTPTVVLCEAMDNYRVAIALVEIDPATTDKLVLVANRCDGRALGKDEGPIRLVVADEKRKLRSIRMLRAIRIVNLADMPLTQVFDGAAKPVPVR